MLKEDWTSEDKFVSTDYNNMINELKLYQLEQTKFGSFSFSEDLQVIEDYIEMIANYAGIDFAKKDWDNLTKITFEDINRLSIAINKIASYLSMTRRRIDENGKIRITENGKIRITE